jgi:Ulp1 family protease
MCKEKQRRKPSLFYDFEFIFFDNNHQPQYDESTRRSSAKSNDIFEMKYILIPIRNENHCMCVVISIEEKKIDNFNSLIVNQTRLGCVHKEELQKSIMQAVLSYLQQKHLKVKGGALPGNWSLNHSCSAQQQETEIDCGVFVCMIIDLIHDGCKLDFAEQNITHGGWRKKMILSILSVNKSIGIDGDDDDDYEVIANEGEQQINFDKKA